MYKITINDEQWLVKETFAGDSLRLFVLAEKDGAEKKMWVNREDLQELDGPAPVGQQEVDAPEPEQDPA